MKTNSALNVVIVSVSMILCGFLSGAFNILQRFLHLMGTVKNAAELNTDPASVSDWLNIAVSVYDIYVLFNLSSGIIAAVQVISGISGLICEAVYTYGKSKRNLIILPIFFCAVCVVFGIVSVISLIALRSMGIFFSIISVITKLIIPIVFLRTLILHNKNRCNYIAKQPENGRLQ